MLGITVRQDQTHQHQMSTTREWLAHVPLGITAPSRLQHLNHVHWEPSTTWLNWHYNLNALLALTENTVALQAWLNLQGTAGQDSIVCKELNHQTTQWWIPLEDPAPLAVTAPMVPRTHLDALLEPTIHQQALLNVYSAQRATTVLKTRPLTLETTVPKDITV